MKESRESLRKIWFLVKKLNRLQKLRLIAKLEKETRQKEWDNLVEKLSRRFKRNPVSDEEITKIVEEVRQERYERSQSRS